MYMHKPAMRTPYEFPPTQTDLRFPRLATTPLHLYWKFLVFIGAAFLTLWQLPFKVALWVAPKGWVEDQVYKASCFVYDVTLPLVEFIQNTLYTIFSTVDKVTFRVWRQIMIVHRENMQHFRVALEAYLRLIQEKGEVIEKHGLRGVPMAVNHHTAKAA